MSAYRDKAAKLFNDASRDKVERRFDNALSKYEEALQLGIERPEEVHTNVGNIYSELGDHVQARRAFGDALRENPDYVPAQFNLAGLLEQSGERGPAIERYEAILSRDPGHWPSLTRLAYAREIETSDDPIVERLDRAFGEAAGNGAARESLAFALGKVLDDSREYPRATAAYRIANGIGQSRVKPYDADATEQAFDRVMRSFGRYAADPSSGHSPVFICGMYRSGTTLLESLLSRHPELLAGGEIDDLQIQIAQQFPQYPKGISQARNGKLAALADSYLATTRRRSSPGKRVINKRPDNFLHIGLIKAMFPNARIVYVHRQRLDNCLSIFFQQLADFVHYATSLDATAHYYDQHDRLMQHWRRSFPGEIHTVYYESLVRSPETETRSVLEFLELDSSAQIVDPEPLEYRSNSASLWQVRKKIHSKSIGRWHNYPELTEHLKRAFARNGGTPTVAE